MANVSVLNTTAQVSGKTLCVAENDQTVSGAWTFTGNQLFNGNVTLGNAAADTLTITATITSHLLFTDNTYDVGASAATRPRDLFLARNATVGGTLSVTGVATLAASTIALRGVTYTLPSADGSANAVLQTNGSAALSWATVGFQPRIITATVFETAARFATVVTGGGTTIYGVAGAEVNTSATGTSSSITTMQMLRANATGGVLTGVTGVWGATCNMTELGSDFHVYLGLGSPTVAGSGITFTPQHAGFKITRAASGTASVFATQANGVTETASSALTTVVALDQLDLCLVVNSASIDYYWRKEGSAWSAVTTLSTNLPSLATEQNMAIAVSNVSVASRAEITVKSAYYSR